MAQNTMKNWTNEELIVEYALHFYEETKKAHTWEQKILKELADRGIIDLEKMDDLYKRKAL